MKEDISSMEHSENLGRLEQFVEKLIDNHNRLKNEKSELMAQLQEKQQEIVELQETVKSLQEDRSVMHNQVTGLIDRIGEWEKILDKEGTGNNSDAGEGEARSLSKESSSLFNIATEQPI
jgi:predicted nuclease with TOPRIM domain